MKIGYRRRLADLTGGLRIQREFAKHERLPWDDLGLYQQRRLESVVRHAAVHSPYYRERLAGVVDGGPVELSRLPTIEKSGMMEHFDRLVTDGRLRRDALLEWVEGLNRDELYLDRYRVMTTSGSSGRKGLFVFDRSEWQAIIAQFLRYSEMSGVRPRLPRRLRVAAVIGPSPSTSTAPGDHRRLLEWSLKGGDAMADGLCEGGCYCGRVRYRVSGKVLRSAICHCVSCRRTSGALTVAWVSFPYRSFSFIEGEPADYRSSDEVSRTFCQSCGTSLTYRHDEDAGSIDVTTASLDQPDEFPPTRHIWMEDKLVWEDVDDGLPRFEQGG